MCVRAFIGCNFFAANPLQAILCVYVCMCVRALVGFDCFAANPLQAILYVCVSVCMCVCALQGFKFFAATTLQAMHAVATCCRCRGKRKRDCTGSRCTLPTMIEPHAKQSFAAGSRSTPNIIKEKPQSRAAGSRRTQASCRRTQASCRRTQVEKYSTHSRAAGMDVLQ